MDLLDDLELGGLGGAHLHRVEPSSFDRPRFIKTAAQALAKWEAGTQLASGQTGSWLQNLQSSSKPIVAAAVQQTPVMLANFQKSINDGKYAAGLAKAGGDAGIKQSAAAKYQNYGNATAAGTPGATKMGNFLTKLIAYEQQNLPQIYAMPKGSIQAGKNRVNAWIDIMAAGAGSF